MNRSKNGKEMSVLPHILNKGMTSVQEQLGTDRGAWMNGGLWLSVKNLSFLWMLWQFVSEHGELVKVSFVFLFFLLV